ncbi:MAG: cytidylate kinase-like family protein [Nitrospirae bacterium]|nr:cytidylate kinase-like family protein [Nitrospirota bacterium]MBF0533874.1 cytidylate kinase-like family protein [Nitrospirota bacterium]MBF0615417.1 cytidylate kinase-like family protein [Nitrospirota bacterium]
MSVITISGAAYGMSRKIAEGVALQMGYKCLGSEIITLASEQFNLSESELREAVENAPSFLGMSLIKRVKLAAYLQSALAKYFLKDNIVYYGPAGEALIRAVAHVLKVRIHADTAIRVQRMQTVENITENEAAKKLLKLDRNRHKVNSLLYKINESDQSVYDLVVELKESDTESVVSLISDEALLPKYKASNYSVHCLKNIELASRVKAALINIDHEIDVRSNGILYIHTKAAEAEYKKRVNDINTAIAEIPGIHRVEITVTEDVFAQYASSMIR